MKNLWQHTAEQPQFPTLEKDIKTEVLIIGGGITGILTAYFLQQQNIPYILVEKDRIC
ncbi:MAG: FAD-dependent oxidoreductase [Clostridia bacterium]|nr:FAD-dependent oxidoreductase [Clostridia bacterium]